MSAMLRFPFIIFLILGCDERIFKKKCSRDFFKTTWLGNCRAYFGIGDFMRIGQEIKCVQYAGFFI